MKTYCPHDDYYRSYLFWCECMGLKLFRARIVAALKAKAR